MAKAHGVEILKNYRFQVSISGGIGPFKFSTVSGLSAESEIIEYRSGQDAAYPSKIPGQASFGDVTMERGVHIAVPGITGLNGLIAWRKHVKDVDLIGNSPVDTITGQTSDTNTVRRTIMLLVYSEDDVGAASYTLYNCWPSALEIGDLDAGSSEVLIETFTVVTERIRRTS